MSYFDYNNIAITLPLVYICFTICYYSEIVVFNCFRSQIRYQELYIAHTMQWDHTPLTVHFTVFDVIYEISYHYTVQFAASHIYIAFK